MDNEIKLSISMKLSPTQENVLIACEMTEKVAFWVALQSYIMEKAELVPGWIVLRADIQQSPF